ncbi:MAG: alginate export family protein [Phycisphaerales bacterium]
MGTRTYFIKLVCFTAILSLCFVQVAGAGTKWDYDPYNGMIMLLKTLPPWLEMGADFRFRVVYDNDRHLDNQAIGHDRLNTRYRGRVQAKIKQSEDFAYNFRIVSEPRYYHRPPSMNKQFTHHEGIFDRFNFVWQNAFDLPATVTVGRQEIKLGSAWLLIDGTPLDGGRTNFFDAVRLTYNLEGWGTTADLIWVQNNGDTAKWLKPFNDRDIDVAEQDEQGAILYLSKKPTENSYIDGYFIYKHDYDRNVSSGYKGETYTFGTRLGDKLGEHWQYCFEFAPQFGHKNGKELSSFATNNEVIYHFNDEDKNRIHFGYEYLSGSDDPDKNFDKVWGRVDTWSVLYQGPIDSIDGRQIDSSNLHRIHLGWVTEPSEKWEIKSAYHLLFADENTSAGGTGGLSKGGNFRGQLLRAQIKYKVSEHIYHRLEGELFFPGDFYNDDRNDVAVFARYGIVFTW